MLIFIFRFIIAHSVYHPIQILKQFWSFLQNSGVFVVFTQFLQPLVEIQSYLIQTKIAINVQLQEMWPREYQVRIYPPLHT